jgi:hypothetical protein
MRGVSPKEAKASIANVPLANKTFHCKWAFKVLLQLFARPTQFMQKIIMFAQCSKQFTGVHYDCIKISLLVEKKLYASIHTFLCNN